MKYLTEITLIVIATFSVTLIGCSDDDGASGSNRAPILEAETFMVEEDAEIGTSVGIVKSIDQDGDIVSFSIVDGNSEMKFEINELSGEISLSGTLDFESTESYVLTIRGDDGEDFTEEDYTIEVIDIDENSTINLITSGTWSYSNALTDGGTADGDWSSFTIKFEGNTDGTYVTTGVPSGFEDVWPAAGSWTYESMENEILRNDDIVITIGSVTETSLTIEFDLPDEGARAAGIYGTWQFDLMQ